MASKSRNATTIKHDGSLYALPKPVRTYVCRVYTWYTWYTYIHTYVQCTFASTSESACEPLSRIFLVFPLHLHRQRGEKQQIEEICMYIHIYTRLPLQSVQSEGVCTVVSIKIMLRHTPQFFFFGFFVISIEIVIYTRRAH